MTYVQLYYISAIRRMVESNQDFELAKSTWLRWIDDLPSQAWEAYHQPHVSRHPGLAEAALIGRLEVWRATGLMPVFEIPLDDSPSKDLHVEENNEVLERLPAPFTATFAPSRGAAGDGGDGTLTWSEVIEFEVSIERVGGGIEKKIHQFKPSPIPLEVGSTEVATTLLHVLHHGGVARWPYGQDQIHLMLATPELREQALTGIASGFPEA